MHLSLDLFTRTDRVSRLLLYIPVESSPSFKCTVYMYMCTPYMLDQLMYIFIHQRINGSTKSTKATLNNLNYSELIVVFRKKSLLVFIFTSCLICSLFFSSHFQNMPSITFSDN